MAHEFLSNEVMHSFSVCDFIQFRLVSNLRVSLKVSEVVYSIASLFASFLFLNHFIQQKFYDQVVENSENSEAAFQQMTRDFVLNGK